MRVYLEYDNETSLLEELSPEELAIEVAGRVLEMEGVEEDVLVNLCITDDEGIHRVNKEFRGIDRETDVLSFPALDPEVFMGEGEVYDSDFDMDTGALVLGDILINANRVLSGAQAYGHAPRREFAFLVAHSMLHLLGYDHMQPQEEEQMIEKQNAVLSSLGIVR